MQPVKYGELKKAIDDGASLSLIQEWHTSDLGSRCAKRVQLKHQGKALPEIGSAMLRGLLFHAHAEAWHLGETASVSDVLESIRMEGRAPTPAALASVEEANEECIGLVGHYAQRFGDYFRASKLIGCEVPVRWTVDVDGKPVDFASHMDLLFRDPHGALCVWDWKTGDTDWDTDHAGRSIQLGMYFMAVQYGMVMIEDEWVELREPPHVSIVNAEHLKPYSRRTTAIDDDGQQREFVKGDARPSKSVRFEVLVNNEAAVVDEFATRVRMARANLWPTNPTDTGCRVCECRSACPSWGRDQTQNQEPANGTL